MSAILSIPTQLSERSQQKTMQDFSWNLARRFGVKFLMLIKPRFVVSFALLTLFFCPSAFSQDGLQLFHKMQDALGGADKIAAIRDFEQLVRAEAINGNTGESMGAVRKRTRWIRPNIVRLDQVGPGSTYVLYFDGTEGWEILPGTSTAIKLDGGELEFARGYVRGFNLKMLLADRDPRYKITSPAPNVVRVSDGDLSHQLDISLDPISWLPVKTAFTTLSDPANPMPGSTVNTEWETVDGIRFARHFVVYRRDVRVAEATVEKTILNSGLKLSDISVKPPDMKPVLPAPDVPRNSPR